jgi:hypothetical protein
LVLGKLKKKSIERYRKERFERIIEKTSLGTRERERTNQPTQKLQRQEEDVVVGGERWNWNKKFAEKEN